MNLLTFDLNLLRVLDALLQEQSTVKAGARIGLSQPAVSSALGRLRLSLGDPLFLRQGQRIVPTDFARSLELPLRRMFDDLESMLSGAADFDPAAATNRFKIAGSDFFAEMLMPPLARALFDRAPGMKVHLVNAKPDDYIGTLENDEADMALVTGLDLPDWIDHVPVFKSYFVMIARNGHPKLEQAGVTTGDTVPLDVLCDLSHAFMSPQGRTRGFGDAALARVGRERRVVMSLPVFSGVYNLVAQSDVVALIPSPLASKVADRLNLSIYKLPMLVHPSHISLAWHKRSTSNPAHRWLRDVVMEILTPLDED
tara:strand:+ start:1078 stop:2013 length:936 start_codon:yes stop_codon:yes gene_type:complete